ncbi:MULTISPECIES: hypothetical protein [Priestia]|nr:hypothetical protein [Priestia megaterium]MDF2013950.1 hypothetical protein [Priestia megaterium]MDP1426885.1 hypothetical protein [Priestia megaterium]MED3870048.1 hypothetical protein [Priestia megaterium]MED4069162.1 hypothetical protein [Priestia megaterium]MED4135696.1 hypothetical protein [Priestia megaterium]
MIGGQDEDSCRPRKGRSPARKSTAVSQAIPIRSFIQFVYL